MSHSTFNNQWHETVYKLFDLLEIEQPVAPRKPQKNKFKVSQLLGRLYIKYIQNFRELEECYDQVVHPQKRRVIRHCLDGVMGRLLEVKCELVSIEYSEFQFFDDLALDMKLTPDKLNLPVPHYFMHGEAAQVLVDRDKRLAAMLARIAPEKSATASTNDEPPMALDEAIRIVQIHERARQGRLRAKFMKEIRAQEERERMQQLQGTPGLDPDSAATKIQTIFRGYSQRKKAKVMREEMLIFLGMIPKPSQVASKEVQEKSSKAKQQRRLTQDQFEGEYQSALVTVKDKLREVEGPDMRETMQDQIRQWFLEVRDSTGKFPDYPADDDGGSASIFQKFTQDGEPADPPQEGKKKKGKKGKKGKKDKKEKKGKKGKGKGKKGKGEEEEDPGWVMPSSVFTTTVAEGCHQYRDVWETRDEKINFQQKHDVEIIKEAKRGELEGEVRKQVDEIMREELTRLKLAIDKEKKGKGGKKKGKKKGGKKKGKKGGKKGKKEKDLTPERTIDSLYEELLQAGVIIRPKKTPIVDYLGDYSYLGTTLRQVGIEPMPSLLDVRRIVTEYCILPLGSQAVHEKAPHIKSVALVGPTGVGKDMLVNAVCTETGANLFDLTPQNVAGKYSGKKETALLIHMVFKVARSLTPSVVLIGDCEKSFMKKVPKSDTSECKRFKKELPKVMKFLKPEDRVLVMGTTKLPFNAETKAFCGMYQKLILIPRPDYGSRRLIWENVILSKQGSRCPLQLDLSCLAKVTDGYTPGHMAIATQAVLTERRISQLHKKPLEASEFIPPLAKSDPIYKEEEIAFKTWFEKTPLGKKRLKALKGDDDGADTGKKGKKGKKGKGKKKRK